MSQAYLIADTKIHDPEKYEAYKRLAKPIVEEFGGEYIVRGGRLDVAQADLWSPSRLVVIRFPNRDAALAFLSSEAYQPVKAIRFASLRGHGYCRRRLCLSAIKAAIERCSPIG